MCDTGEVRGHGGGHGACVVIPFACFLGGSGSSSSEDVSTAGNTVRKHARRETGGKVQDWFMSFGKKGHSCVSQFFDKFVETLDSNNTEIV